MARKISQTLYYYQPATEVMGTRELKIALVTLHGVQWSKGVSLLDDPSSPPGRLLLWAVRSPSGMPLIVILQHYSDSFRVNFSYQTDVPLPHPLGAHHPHTPIPTNPLGPH